MLSVTLTAYFMAMCLTVLAFLGLRHIPARYRVSSFVLISTVLLTPSILPAGIYGFLLPLAGAVVAFVVMGSAHELPELLLAFWWLHLPAAALIGFFSLKLGQRMLSNQSFKADGVPPRP
jgi:hypothetical protein